MPARRFSKLRRSRIILLPRSVDTKRQLVSGYILFFEHHLVLERILG